MAIAQSHRGGQPVMIDVGQRFHHSEQGARFVATHQTPGTAILGQTAFVATTPTFLLRQAGADRRLIINSIILGQVAPVAANEIEIFVLLDNIDRLSGATGVLVALQNYNMGDTSTSGATFRTLATAIAASANVRVVASRVAPAVLGTQTIVDVDDEIIIPLTGSMLIYAIAAGTGPSLNFEVNFSEIE